MRVNGGVAEVRLWSDWVKARPVKLEGTLSAFALALTPVASGVANQPGNEQHKAGYASQSYLVDTLSGKTVEVYADMVVLAKTTRRLVPGS